MAAARRVVRTATFMLIDQKRYKERVEMQECWDRIAQRRGLCMCSIYIQPALNEPYTDGVPTVTVRVFVSKYDFISIRSLRLSYFILGPRADSDKNLGRSDRIYIEANLATI